MMYLIPIIREEKNPLDKEHMEQSIKFSRLKQVTEYAYKKILKTEFSIEEITALLRIMQMISYYPTCATYFMCIKRIFQDGSSYGIIMEYISGYTFTDYREYNMAKEDYHKNILMLFQQLLFAVSILHGRDIVHRDIKVDNVMVQNGIIKLIDFDLAVAPTVNPDELYITFNHYNVYHAPEIITEEHMDCDEKTALAMWKANDIWACG